MCYVVISFPSLSLFIGAYLSFHLCENSRAGSHFNPVWIDIADILKADVAFCTGKLIDMLLANFNPVQKWKGPTVESHLIHQHSLWFLWWFFFCLLAMLSALLKVPARTVVISSWTNGGPCHLFLFAFLYLYISSQSAICLATPLSLS